MWRLESSFSLYEVPDLTSKNAFKKQMSVVFLLVITEPTFPIGISIEDAILGVEAFPNCEPETERCFGDSSCIPNQPGPFYKAAMTSDDIPGRGDAKLPRLSEGPNN